MQLFQFQNGYRYNSDSLFFYNFLRSQISPNFHKNALDVGSGCGILALLFARDFPKASVFGVEILEKNYLLCRKNAALNKLNAAFINADFTTLNSKTFAEFVKTEFDFDKQNETAKTPANEANFKFDAIFSNPPFYASLGTSSQNAHLDLARDERHLPMAEFFLNARKLLTPNGKFYFCYDTQRLNEIFFNLNLANLNVTKIQFLHTRKEKKAKIAFFETQPFSKKPCVVLPNAVIYENGEEVSEFAKEVFVSCWTQSLNFEEVDDEI